MRSLILSGAAIQTWKSFLDALRSWLDGHKHCIDISAFEVVGRAQSSAD